MTRIRFSTGAMLLALLAGGCQSAATDHESTTMAVKNNRLIVPALINGQPANLAFDTGASLDVLFRTAADRLQIKYTEPPADARPREGQVVAGITENCTVQMLGQTLTRRFAVIAVPGGINPDIDGMLSWTSLNENILLFDPRDQTLRLGKVPPQTTGWTKWKIMRGPGILRFDVAPPDAPAQIVCLDTGNQEGVALEPQQLAEWQAAHPNAPRTLGAYYMPGSGLVVAETWWADELEIGGHKFTNVPVQPTNVTQRANGGPGFIADFGMYALSRNHLILDGPSNAAYLRAADVPFQPYTHNRLGAVFTPTRLDRDPLYAHVLTRTPAAEAGIRTGDELLRIDDYDATKWRSPDSPTQSSFWEKPAGTRYRLLLRRDGQEFTVTVTLRDLIGPGLTR